MYKVENASRSPIAIDDKGLAPGQSIVVSELSAMAQFLRDHGVIRVTRVTNLPVAPKPTPPAPKPRSSRSGEPETTREE